LSGTRIPDGSHRTRVEALRDGEAAARSSSPHKNISGKPESEGQKPVKISGGGIPVTAKDPVAQGQLHSQKAAFGVQQGQVSQLNTALQASLPQNILSENPFEIPPDKITYAREVFRQAAINLGIPQDTLSFSLLVFARYFSLPVKPALIWQLRREILSAGRASSPESAEGKAALEADAMAAVIAADKGLSLSPEALARYARFLLPPVFPGNGDKKEEPRNGEELPNMEMEELKALAQGEEQTDNFLGFINMVPGKNGQYWIVYPFNIKAKGTELRVFLRILKKGFLSATGSEELIIDISGQKRQWRCFLIKSSGKVRVDIRVYSECSPKGLNLLLKEAERFLRERNIPVPGLEGFFRNSDICLEVQVRNGDKIPSLTEDLFIFCLPSISKDV